MTNEQKKEIAEAVGAHLKKGNTAKELSEITKVNRRYISAISKGEFHLKSDFVNQKTGKKESRKTVIQDKHFLTLANYFGIDLGQIAPKEAPAPTPKTTEIHWDTENYKDITARCRFAQSRQKRVLIDGFSGAGKTYSLRKYATENKKVVYVRATSSMGAKDLLREILMALKVENVAKTPRKMLLQLEEILTERLGWLLIIDEAEDIKVGIYKTIKEIAVFAENKCGFALCGIGITRLFERKAQLGKTPFMQLKRRFFGNKITFPSIQKEEIKAICEQNGITNKTAISWFVREIDDFDMFVDYIRDVRGMCEAQSLDPNGITSKNLQYFFNN